MRAAATPRPALMRPVAPLAPSALHPRYRGVWEEKPDLWPDHLDWEARVLSRHDFTERRWLTPAHRAALDAGTLNVPDRTQNEHAAVLVSVPDGPEGTPVAWVDRGVAEIVHHAARLGAPTAESCENAGGEEGHYGWPPDMAMLWFDDQDGLDRFDDLIDDDVNEGLLWFEPPRRRFVRRRDRIYAVAIAQADLPRIAGHLRRKT